MREIDIACDNNILYHYTSVKTAIDFVLQDRKLRLSSLKKTNDPKETRFPVIPWTPSPNFKEISEKGKIIRSMFEEYTKVICFTLDKAVKKEIIKGYNRPTMWAHYGDNHEGVCLSFKKDLILKQIKASIDSRNIIHGKVKYGNSIEKDVKKVRIFTQDDFVSNSLDGVYDEYSKKIFHKIKPFFLTKRLDWNPECEYRIIINEFNTDYAYFDFGNALSRIILGSNVTQNLNNEDYIKLIEFSKEYNVQLSHMVWSFGLGCPVNCITK